MQKKRRKPIVYKSHYNPAADGSVKGIDDEAQKVRLDVMRSFFGGITPLWDVYREVGYTDMSRKAVEKWFERGKFPPDKFRVITMYIAQKGLTEKLFNHAVKMGVTPEDLFI